jgi:hemerythrin superfamily protein
MGIEGLQMECSLPFIGEENRIGRQLMDAVDLIKQDHRRIERMLDRFLETESEMTQEDLSQEIQTGLTIHAEIEERVLYPAVRHFARKQVNEAIKKDAKVREILMDLLDADLNEQTLEERFTQLMEDVRNHIEEQEAQGGLLELARRHLDADTLVEMAAQMTRIQRGLENLAA